MSDDEMPSLAYLMDGDDEEISDVDYVAARVAESTRSGFHSGFVCFVGRPNAGKSTLTNALVGSKIAIASSKPQTTRHVIRGVVTDENSQIVVIDTPGLHKPRTLLGQPRLRHLDPGRRHWGVPAVQPADRAGRHLSRQADRRPSQEACTHRAGDEIGSGLLGADG